MAVSAAAAAATFTVMDGVWAAPKPVSAGGVLVNTNNNKSKGTKMTFTPSLAPAS